jgi:hypothetical protein
LSKEYELVCGHLIAYFAVVHLKVADGILTNLMMGGQRDLRCDIGA